MTTQEFDHGPIIPFMFPARMPLVDPSYDEKAIGHSIAKMFCSGNNPSILMTVASPSMAVHAWTALPLQHRTSDAFYSLFMATGFAFPIMLASACDPDAPETESVRMFVCELLTTGGVVAPVISQYLPPADSVVEFLQTTIASLISFVYAEIVNVVKSVNKQDDTPTPTAIGALVLYSMLALTDDTTDVHAAIRSLLAINPTLFSDPLGYVCEPQYITAIATVGTSPALLKWIAPHVIQLLTDNDLIQTACAYTAYISCDTHADACFAASRTTDTFSAQWRTHVQTVSISPILQAVLFVWQDPAARKHYIREARVRLREEGITDDEKILDTLSK